MFTLVFYDGIQKHESLPAALKLKSGTTDLRQFHGNVFAQIVDVLSNDRKFEDYDFDLLRTLAFFNVDPSLIEMPQEELIDAKTTTDKILKSYLKKVIPLTDEEIKLREGIMNILGDDPKSTRKIREELAGMGIAVTNPQLNSTLYSLVGKRRVGKRTNENGTNVRWVKLDV